MGRKILIADDEPAAVALVEAVLENDGTVVVLGCYDGEEALSIARQEKPEVIFLDVNMPKMSGFQVCKVLKDDPDTNQIKVVMLTGLDYASYRTRAIEVGADDYLTKPFLPIQFFNKLQEILKQPVPPMGEK